MPTDQSTASANVTSRRSFLARTAVGGAVLSAGPVAAPFGAWLGAGTAGAAGAQAKALADEEFAQFATPLELAAVSVYQAALEGGRLGDDWSSDALTLQGHHQEVAEALTEMLPEGATAVPAAAFARMSLRAVESARTEEAVLVALAGVEDTLSATHLLALESLTDPTTAKLVAQVLASEAQAAAALGLAGGTDLEALTPAEASTDGALEPGAAADGPGASEDGSSGDGSSGDGSSGDGSSGDSGSGTPDNAGNGSTDSGDGSSSSGDNSGGDTGGGSGSGSDSGSGDTGGGADSGSSSGSTGGGAGDAGNDAGTSSGSN